MMSDEKVGPPCWTVKLNLRTATFALAGALATLGTGTLTALAVLAAANPGREVTLGSWLIGKVGITLVLAAILVCGLAVLGKVMTDRLAWHARALSREMKSYVNQLHGEVEAYQAGVDTTLGIFKQALPRKLPANVHELRPNGASEYADAN